MASDFWRGGLLCAAFASVLAFALSAHGQGKTLGYILGDVFSSSGPVADATVTAWHVDTASPCGADRSPIRSLARMIDADDRGWRKAP